MFTTEGYTQSVEDKYCVYLWLYGSSVMMMSIHLNVRKNESLKRMFIYDPLFLLSIHFTQALAKNDLSFQ